MKKNIGKIILIVTVCLCLFAGAYCLICPVVERVEVDIEEMSLYVGDYRNINYVIYPQSIEHDCVISSSSSNEQVATAHSDYVKAIAVGRATITLHVRSIYDIYTVKEASFDVIVNSRPVSGIELESEFSVIQVGTEMQIESKVYPTNATDKTLVWTSSNPQAINVDQNGKVTALEQGTAEIRATANSGVFKSLVIKAQNEILIESFSITNTSDLNRGESRTLVCEVSPSNATNTQYTWESSAPDIISVDKNGKITAHKVGAARITATTSNGKTASCYIIVPVVEPLTFNLKVDFQEIRQLKAGDSYQIEYSYYPSNVTYTIEWRSSHPNIVSVSQTGLIMVHSSGSAVIYAKLSTIERTIIFNII